MLIKILALTALYLHLNAYLVNAFIEDVDESSVLSTYFSPDRIEHDRYRIKNKMGDLKTLEKGTLDRTCKTLQVRRFQKLYPALLAHEANTQFDELQVQPPVLGAKSVAEYEHQLPHTARETDQYEYRLVLVDGTPYRKEIYRVPSLSYIDTRGNEYTIDEGYFGLDDYNVTGRPLIFEPTGQDRVKLVAYEDTIRFEFPQKKNSSS